MTFHLHPDDAALSAAAERLAATSTVSTLRPRFRQLASFVLHALLCVTTLVFLYLVAMQAFGDAGPAAFMLGLMCWGSAYLGGRLAGARAHLGVPNLASVGEALVQVALALDRNQRAVQSLADLDTSERAAATSMLMQAKGAIASASAKAQRLLAPAVYRSDMQPDLDDADKQVTEAIEELSCVHWDNENAAVDEAAAAVKH